MTPVSVGLLGCGAIAPAYLQNLTGPLSGLVKVAACADVIPEAARKRAEEFGVPRACTADELLADPSIDLVINLTPAPAHHASSLQVLRAGKHLFTEKPLALSRAHAREILDLAAARGLRVAGAADIFLGSALQKARALLAEGRIGTPIAGMALVSLGAFRSDRYHNVFRGALLDLGPYYLGALTYLLGPVSRVAAAAEVRFAEKPYPAESPSAGKSFPVDQASTTAGVLDFVGGPVATVVASHDVHGYFPKVELFGTEGSLLLADGNFYPGSMTLRTPKGTEDITATEADGFNLKGRGLGVAEMALALREGRAPRAEASWMYHILDVSLAHFDSSREGRHIGITSRFTVPAPFAGSELEKVVRAG